MDIKLLESKRVGIGSLELNKGQIRGLPKNPRFIRDAAFNKLKKSIETDPEMLAMREILVYPFNGKYVIIGGNMRYRALKELGETECIVKVIPEETTADQLRRITIKDNGDFGEWDFDVLANEFNIDELVDCGIEDWKIGEEGEEKQGGNSEVDVDEFEDKQELKVKFTPEQYQFVLGKLREHGDDFAKSLLEILGYGRKDNE